MAYRGTWRTTSRMEIVICTSFVTSMNFAYFYLFALLNLVRKWNFLYRGCFHWDFQCFMNDSFWLLFFPFPFGIGFLIWGGTYGIFGGIFINDSHVFPLLVVIDSLDELATHFLELATTWACNLFSALFTWKIYMPAVLLHYLEE